MLSLTQRIKEKACQLGFSLVGVAGPEPPPHLDVYRNWIELGYQGEMDYLATERAIEKRANPRAILPECKSILVLAIPYSNPAKGSQAQDGQGRIAAYAWGKDYHEVLKSRLRAIVKFIEEEIGQPVPNRWYTDSGPLLERELAQRAGLGWIGKNSMLIHPERGSYFLLAEILLGIELDQDPPFATDHCGTCTRCIQACPTHCILPNRTLDANRCISYLTIELKGPVPEDLRSQMGEWVFGCDICQIVCPWNERFATAQGEPVFMAKHETDWVKIEKALSISAEEFNRKFKNSSVKRAKRRGYLRNVAIAAGNAKSREGLPPLATALSSDPDALVRGHAAWALGQIGGGKARTPLERALKQERDGWVLAEIKAALRVIAD